ncbi:kelch-like protein diablo [Adelges cooleyi]|uniref:kelch-like protein diablo n=1 Tax=Adelges cooleyi TaxID=133065 RepID=UPI00217F73D9|nr:kelch-like protein diablo [Adelges cooleyi]
MVESEKKIFNFIMKWIKYDIDERSKYLANLLNYLRLPLISKKELQRICDEPLLNSQKDCLIFIMKNYLFVDVDENIINATVGTSQLYKPNIFFAIKGQSNGDDSCVKYMDLRHEDDLNWKSCDYSFFCPPRDNATLVVSDTGILLAFGGYNKLGEWNNCIDELDLTSTSKMWIPTTPLRKIRKQFAVSTQGKFIYVVGGQDPLGPTLSSIEYYDTDSKVWAEIEQPMPYPRYGCSAINHGSCLYVFGGYYNNDRLSRVDCYNLQEKLWKQCNSMPTVADSMGITSGGNDLYLFGSYPSEISEYAYKMNLTDLTWDKLPNMNNKKAFGNAVTFENDIFVVGKNSIRCLSKNEKSPDSVFCERYIAEKKEWQVINSKNKLIDYDHIICLNDVRLKTFNIDL